MNNKNLIRSLILGLSILIIASILLGNHTETTQANTDVFIPEEGYRNEWQWNDTIDVGDKLMYEITYKSENLSYTSFGGRLVKDNFILNITSINNDTILWPTPLVFSQINATQLYYNCSDDQLYEYEDGLPFRIAASRHDPSSNFQYFIGNERLAVPFVLPFNDTINNNFNLLAQSLNQSFYDPYYQYGIINKWNSYSYNDINRNIRFENSSGYFADLTFFENGTLNSASMFFLQLHGADGYHNVTINLKRIYEPNVLSETEWGFEEGDEIYLGLNDIEPGRSEFMEIKVIVDQIVTDLNNTYAFRLYGGPMIDQWTCFSYVIGDVRGWNPQTKDYDQPIQTDFNLLVANNHYPFLFTSDENKIITNIPENVETSDLLYVNEFYKFYQDDYPFENTEVMQENGFTIVNQTKTEGGVLLNYYNTTSGKGVLRIEEDGTGNEYSVAYPKEEHIITDDTPKALKNEYGQYLKWDAELSIDYSNDIKLYTALFPQSPVNFSTIMIDVLGHEGFDVGFNDELSEYRVYLELYSNYSDSLTESDKINITFSYDNGLKTLLDARGYSLRDLRPYYLYNDSSNNQDFDYFWLPLDNQYIIDIDEDNNEIIFSIPPIDIDMEYLYITVGLSTSADIDYSVQPGDVFYYGGFDDEPQHNGTVVETKVVIDYVGIERRSYNMTDWYANNGDGIIFNGPGPEIQDFILVEANVSRWNNETKSFDQEDPNIKIGLGNNYFALFPFELQSDLRAMFLPIGTVGSDLVKTAASPYDGASTIETEHVRYTSVTYSGKFIDFRFNSTTGQITNIYGWGYKGSGNFMYLSQFEMHNETLLTGENLYSLKSELITENTFTANISAAGETDFYYGLIDNNPVNESISGTPLFFLDILINDSSKVSFMTLLIQLSSSYDVSKMDLNIYAWLFEDSIGRHEWNSDPPPSTTWDDWITIDNQGNNISIVIPFDPSRPIDFLVAVSYTTSSPAPPAADDDDDDDDDGAPAAIPGFEIYIILASVTLISLLVILKRRKLVK
ncbi:MAG: hypothetical protein GF383_15780 [Candidatus Lokiarchaeota archaeon]|nr:hypothetical protein [Candidatus Lokiarchaeota archaeon]MBD3343160.1 hypothetical protein [Candidatus Lokiarchaeota archaeon]